MAGEGDEIEEPLPVAAGGELDRTAATTGEDSWQAFRSPFSFSSAFLHLPFLQTGHLCLLFQNPFRK